MRLIAFPGHGLSPEQQAALVELEAALDGDGTGPEADYWRELRADVRGLAPPIDPTFEQALRGRLHAAQPPVKPRRGLRSAVSGAPRRPLLAAAATFAVIGASAVTVLALTGGRAGSVHSAPALPDSAVFRSGAPDSTGTASGPRLSAPAVHSARTDNAGRALSPPLAAGAEAPGQTGGRLQNLGASISLGAGTQGVQQLAGRVGRLAVAAGGFVESSRVQLQQGASGEALMLLQIPSAKLPATLAQLERIAPVRAEAQSLQDVTGQCETASARLSAARAERAALLRALAGATTPAAIESLHARLAQAGRQIAAAERQRTAVSRRAARAQVEVTVLGEAAHGGGGLTLRRGLDEAGHVLAVSLAVLMIAAAVLIPLGIALTALALGGRYWRRQRRERVLSSR